jgi:DnaK suppressor protein
MTDPAAQLAELRDATVRRIADLRAELADVIDSASSTTADDEHDPEGATIGFERAQAAALLAGAEQQLREVGAALERVAAGTYGRCSLCGRPIAADRLAARPTAERCIACAGAR